MERICCLRVISAGVTCVECCVSNVTSMRFHEGGTNKENLMVTGVDTQIADGPRLVCMARLFLQLHPIPNSQFPGPPVLSDRPLKKKQHGTIRILNLRSDPLQGRARDWYRDD